MHARNDAIFRRDVPIVDSKNGYCDATSSSFLKKDPNVTLRTLNTLFCHRYLVNSLNKCCRSLFVRTMCGLLLQLNDSSHLLSGFRL